MTETTEVEEETPVVSETVVAEDLTVASTVSGSEAEAKEWIAQKNQAVANSYKRTLYRTLPIDRFILER